MNVEIPITGLYEAHLPVSDLHRSVAFYRDVLGLEQALEVPDRSAVFFWLGGPQKAMLALWSIGTAPFSMSVHVAFNAALEDVLAAPAKLEAAGITPLSFFGRPTDEATVIGWMPAASVFFRDPDNHLLEYLAILDEEPRPEVGFVPWSTWAAAHE
ncbi:MAG TPA: VOC family protein [Gaiellaceae bacterium]